MHANWHTSRGGPLGQMEMSDKQHTKMNISLWTTIHCWSDREMRRTFQCVHPLNVRTHPIGCICGVRLDFRLVLCVEISANMKINK